MTLHTWLAEQAAQRDRDGLVRSLTTRIDDDDLIDLAGNDYLGLCRDERVTAAAADAAVGWGAGASASRLVTGTLPVHTALEATLSQRLGHEAALVHSTGYHANLSAVTALSDRDTLLVSDAHVHASLVDACRLSRGTLAVVGHNDVAAVEARLAGRTQSRALVLVESIYSVLGDAAPLEQLVELCERHDATLIVDEAHGVGVAGDGGGLVRELGLAGRPSVVVTMTLSKALGSQGGAVLGSQAVVDHLVNRSRPFIYDTGLAPAAAAGALEALRIIDAEPERVTRLHQVAAALADAAGVARVAGAVLSVEMPGPAEALAAQASCAADGVRVGCFRPPSTPDGISRLRLTASAGVDDDQLAHAGKLIATVVP
ncbi:8-amino-7-oxononanoate synthase [Aeromicrobium sp. Root236]|uniref:aminotransferase class I/II-fold pyridoxal phosphate-dependent enzyme n=1 Tax=Aeromicrobium sp. Root236 TaxID=1736498 RepID=UPI000700E462|nr:aminotransferase class I/II-fold pyridoxal phosphate-dependent enzyme [Aeromicrobium sp. Root236]KRC65726.1 8-amino-7-oxononanoate synthase [Aeromicrobium sp. Root236]